MGRAIADTPENFAVLSGLLLADVFAFYPKVSEIIFDRHFHKEKDINVADMVAGAVLARESGKNKHFYEMFKDSVISELKLNWPEAKRKLLRR